MKIYNNYLALLIFIFIGCSSQPELVQTKIDDADLLFAKALTIENPPVAFKGTASLTIENETEGARLTCRFYFNSLDTLRLEINTGFGFGILTAWLTRDSILVSNRISKQFIRSDYRSGEVQKLVGAMMTFDDVLLLFLGRIPKERFVQSSSILKEQDDLLYIFNKDGGSDKVWISKLFHKPTRWVKLGIRGRLIHELIMERFKNINGHYYAQKVELSRPNEKERIAIFINSMEVTEKNNSKLSIPNEMEMIKL